MINVTNEFKKIMNERTDFKENAEIIFLDGTSLELSEADFTVSNNGIVDAADTNGIPLGVAVCRSIQIELMNDNDRFSEYDFLGATIRLYLTFQLSKSIERIECGTFTVLTPETYGTTVIITALDDMYKSDRNYESNLVFPATTGSMLLDACNTLGISQGTTTFLNDDFVVQEKPVNITFRQLFGYIAMIAGGNARIDTTGRLRIITYNFEELERLTRVINGGFYLPWNNPANIDGGSFNPWNVGDVADGGLFTDGKEYHTLSNWKNLKIDTDYVVITGIQNTYTDSENEEHTVLYGVEGYVLSIENPLIAGKEEFAVELIGNVMVGGRFRQFTGDIVANPTIEFMDIALIVDRKGNAYSSFVTDINFEFFGFTSVKNSAEPALRNSAKAYSDATQALVAARKMIKNERNAREKAVEQLAKDLQNSSGLFMTQQKQPDGSIIYYMHDKSTLAESMIVWKLTALAFGISTDGGKTYPYGFTVDGTTITRLLYAEGIDADYINTGAIRIDDNSGKTIFLADYGTKQVYIDANQVKIGSDSIIDLTVQKNGVIAAINLSPEKIEISADKVNISGLINAINGNTTTTIDGGKITTNTITANQIAAETITGDKLNVNSVAASIVNADSFTSKFATIDRIKSAEADISSIKSDYITTNELNVQIGRINTIESSYIKAEVVKADYMEVANWTSAGYIKAEKIDVNSIIADIGKYEDVIFAHNLKVYSRLGIGEAVLTSSAIFKKITVNGITYSVLCES